MKQVDKRPTEGQWVEVWEYDGKMWSDTFKLINGVVHVNTDRHGEAFSVDYHYKSNHEGGTNNYKYFIAEPALKEITFKEDYELLKWLKDNAGEYLYSDETKSVKAYWIDGALASGYRVTDGTSVHAFLHSNRVQQKTWYHY